MLRPPRLVATVVSLSLLVGACGGDDEVAEPTSTSSTSTTTQPGEPTQTSSGSTTTSVPGPPSVEEAAAAADAAFLALGRRGQELGTGIGLAVGMAAGEQGAESPGAERLREVGGELQANTYLLLLEAASQVAAGGTGAEVGEGLASSTRALGQLLVPDARQLRAFEDTWSGYLAALTEYGTTLLAGDEAGRVDAIGALSDANAAVGQIFVEATDGALAPEAVGEALGEHAGNLSTALRAFVEQGPARFDELRVAGERAGTAIGPTLARGVATAIDPEGVASPEAVVVTRVSAGMQAHSLLTGLLADNVLLGEPGDVAAAAIDANGGEIVEAVAEHLPGSADAVATGLTDHALNASEYAAALPSLDEAARDAALAEFGENAEQLTAALVELGLQDLRGRPLPAEGIESLVRSYVDATLDHVNAVGALRLLEG